MNRRTLFSVLLNDEDNTYTLQGVDIQAVIDDIRKLKIIVKGHERRIKSLEEQLSVYESQSHRDSY